MATYALVKDGLVINTILWEGPEVAPLEFEGGVIYAEIPDKKGVLPSVGWSYDGKSFSSPPLTGDEKAQQDQQLISMNTSQKQLLIDKAGEMIGILQDAVDLDMATTDESAALPLWKKYRVLLSRVDVSKASQIAWPEKP